MPSKGGKGEKMKDINIEAEEILRKTGYRVVFEYPGEQSKVPAISYRTVYEHPIMAADNEELIREVSIQVDIWTKKAADGGHIAGEVNALMTENGWAREFLKDMDKENNIYHTAMRFTKSFVCCE